MLQLVDLSKHYRVVNQYGKVISSETIKALDGVNLTLPDSGLVSVIGTSGSGKSTLMSVLAGLTRPEKGSDIIVDGISTNSYSENQWNNHRNTCVGMIFQQYHLIEQLSVLDNVKLSLDLAGISGKAKVKQAKELLDRLGLSQHIYKTPNTLSGGQKQRVAIARAIINKPRILLCDEPTGALDSATGRDIMQLLRDISRDTLVIVVTHDMNIATSFSDRIVSLSDGRVTDDSVNTPQCAEAVDVIEHQPTTKPTKKKHTVMSRRTALRLSCQNMIAKIKRTILTTLGCMVGIIGVAMSMAVSYGFGIYFDSITGEAMYTRSVSVPLTTTASAIYLEESGLNSFSVRGAYDGDTISSDSVYNVVSSDYASYVADMNSDWYYEILPSYTLQVPYCTYTADSETYRYFSSDELSTFVVPSAYDLYSQQYTVKAGSYTINQYEVVIVTDYSGSISDSMINYLLPEWDSEQDVLYSDFVGLTINIPTRDNWYKEQADFDTSGLYYIDTDAEQLYNGDCWTVTITGVVQPTSSSSTISPSSSRLGMLDELYQTMLADSTTCDAMVAQMLDVDTCIFTGKDLSEYDGLRGGKMTYVEYCLVRYGATTTPEEYRIFPNTLDNKDNIVEYLSSYNTDLDDESKIYAFDLVDSATALVSEVVELVIALLTWFSVIAIVVSSIMIGVVAYTAVLEQKNKIGLLRSIGARRSDIIRIFNTENVLIGLLAGILGAVVAIFVCPPISELVFGIVAIPDIALMSPAIVLTVVALSVTVNLLAGLIPAVIASNQDPIDCLNTVD